MRRTSRPMPFTEEQMKQVFDTSIIDFALSNGLQLEKGDRATMHVKGLPNGCGGLYIFNHGRGYYWFSKESKGNIIDFAKDYFELSSKTQAIEMILGCHAYDDGIAFRYAINNQSDKLTISSESTGFRLASGSIAQAMDYEYANESVAKEKPAYKLRSSYCMPLLYKTKDNTWALISEAALNSTYCGAQLVGDGSGLLNVAFTPEQETDVVTTAPFKSPWRFAVIGTPKDIAENTMAENLSPECALKDTSWIQPGTTDWTWLNGDLRHTDPNV